jgi:hypothetical protein
VLVEIRPNHQKELAVVGSADGLFNAVSKHSDLPLALERFFIDPEPRVPAVSGVYFIFFHFSSNPDLSSCLPVIVQQRGQPLVHARFYHNTKNKARQFYQNYLALLRKTA